MSNLTLKASDGTAFETHPAGIHNAVCVDVVDLGYQDGQNGFAGRNMIQIVWETDKKNSKGEALTIWKNFGASLAGTSKLKPFLEKWRGRPVLPDEQIDLQKLVGACCTLMSSVSKNTKGYDRSEIDAVAKPTVKLEPSGKYDPAATRARIEKWKNKDTRAQPQNRPVNPPASARSLPGVSEQQFSAPTPPAPNAAAFDPNDDVPF